MVFGLALDIFDERFLSGECCRSASSVPCPCDSRIRAAIRMAQPPSMKTRLKLLVLLMAVSALGGLVFLFFPLAAPVYEGTSAEFWKHACGLNLSRAAPAESDGFIYATQGEWFIYYDQEIHRQVLYRVKESVAMADFPSVVAALQTHSKSPDRSYVQEGFRAWKAADTEGRDVRLLLAEIRKARLAELKHAYPNESAAFDSLDDEFETRWHRANRYWLTAVFEFGYLAGLILFVAVPWLRQGGCLAWAMHLGLVPLLLLLPWYLGYVPWVFTSAFPDGGILYPWLVIPLRGFTWTKVDSFILQHIPKILEPLSQSSGAPMAISGLGAFGPVAAFWTGLVIGACSFAVGTMYRFIRKPSSCATSADAAIQPVERREMLLVVRIYWWMGAVGIAAYIVGAAAFAFSDLDGDAIATVFAVVLTVFHAACLATFVASIYVARRLSTRPKGLLPFARIVAITLATAYFPLMTVPGLMCLRRLNKYFAPFCALMETSAET